MVVEMADWKVSKYQKRLIKRVLKSGRLTYGEVTKKFEEKFAEVNGHEYALFTNSGTSALKIAIHALKDKYGWKDGDEVIIPGVTFVATMNVVLMNNLKPVLVDIDGTVNIDPNEIESVITKKTRAIIPVHLLGQPADMKLITAIARKHDLRVIEDSCETMFIPIKHRGDVTCYSSYIAHLMVTGVGGLICTDDKDLATIMRSMMFHGRDESYLNIDDKPQDISKRFWFPRFGYSDRMTELEAALGLGDLKNPEKMIRKRQDNAIYLMAKLKGLPISFPVVNPRQHAFMFFPMLIYRRNKLMTYLEEHGIRTRTMMPLTTQPLVKKYLKDTFLPITDIVNRNGLLIGCHQYLEKEDLDYIIKTIRGFYA
jgi:CDP-6-deoxy-D-xylo-4-hexulose-3-dehydrase